MIYRITRKELSLLMMFSNVKMLSGYEDIQILDNRPDALECLKSLTEKGYLEKNPEDKYSIDEKLEAWIISVSKPYGYMIMENASESGGRKTVIYFKRDSIVVLTNKGDEYELMWLPALPFAIGHIANEINIFKNTETVHIGKYSMNEFENNEEKIIGTQYQPEYMFYVFECGTMTGSISVYASKNEQLMLCFEEDKVSVLKPQKSEYINTITRLMAPIHANAIKEVTNNVRL